MAHTRKDTEHENVALGSSMPILTDQILDWHALMWYEFHSMHKKISSQEFNRYHQTWGMKSDEVVKM